MNLVFPNGGRVFGSLFIALSMLGTFWSISLQLSDMTKEYFRAGRFLSWLIATAPSFLLALLPVSGFLALLQIAGGATAVVVACMAVPAYRNAIVLEYAGVYRFATACNPLLRALHYPPLPGKNEAAHFAYVSFLISRENDSTIERILLGEISAAARDYGFLTIGAANGTTLGHYLNTIKSIKIGSRLCVIDHDKSGAITNSETPVWFECALL